MKIVLAIMFIIVSAYCLCVCKINDNKYDRQRDDEAYMKSINKEKNLKEHENFLLKRFTNVK